VHPSGQAVGNGVRLHDQAVGGIDIGAWRSVASCAVASSAERRADFYNSLGF
jgi:hypothetical protein